MVTFSLVDSSNGKFAIVGNTIRVAAPLDYETNAFHTITVAALGTTPRVANQSFVINIIDVDDPAIALSGNTVIENAATGTTVGTLSVAFTSGAPIYSLVDSAGGKFVITGSELKTAGVFDFVANPSHIIVIAVTGVSPQPPNKTVNIIVIPVPKSIILSNNTILETIANGATIGDLSVWKGTGTYTFTVIGDPDGLFTIDSADLDKAGIVDYETKTSHSVTIRADNGAGDVLTQTFTIFVTDVLDTTPPVTYPPGTTGDTVWGRGIYIHQTATRQYIVGAGLYVNEVV